MWGGISIHSFLGLVAFFSGTDWIWTSNTNVRTVCREFLGKAWDVGRSEIKPCRPLGTLLPSNLKLPLKHVFEKLPILDEIIEELPVSDEITRPYSKDIDAADLAKQLRLLPDVYAETWRCRASSWAKRWECAEVSETVQDCSLSTKRAEATFQSSVAWRVKWVELVVPAST